jgi:hypothetical protein
MWEDFRWQERFIFIREEVSKLGEARDVPFREPLYEMLEPLKSIGQVYQKTRLDAEYARIGKKAKVVWKHNALRHSAISYEMQLSPIPADVADRAGNSVVMIESNYRRKGVTADQAKAWFALMPRVRWGAFSVSS